MNPALENITSLYNNVINSNVSKQRGYPIREKNRTQVSRKLAHLQEKQAVVHALGNYSNWKLLFWIHPVSTATSQIACDMNQTLTLLKQKNIVTVPLHETHFVVKDELILGERLLTNIIWKIQETSYIRLLRRSEVSKVSKIKGQNVDKLSETFLYAISHCFPNWS